MTVRVLVVEDEQLAAEAHASYVGRVPGFELAGVARSAGDAARLLESDSRVDLLLLDMHLPDGHGLGLLQRLRAQGHLIDVIAVTSARDAEVVRHAVAQGVVLYLLKPFAFAAFRAKLEQYATYREGLAAATPELAQDEVDRLMDPLRASAGVPDLPKGMSGETLSAVSTALRDAGAGLSASEVAAAVGASRVTVRRYLEHLADSGGRPRYGGAAPEVEYRWGAAGDRPEVERYLAGGRPTEPPWSARRHRDEWSHDEVDPCPQCDRQLRRGRTVAQVGDAAEVLATVPKTSVPDSV